MCEPYFRQGDLFEAVPAPVLDVDRGDDQWSTLLVSALLVSWDCIIDKRSRRGVPSVEAFQFLPARRLDLLNDSNREALLVRRELQPPAGFLVGRGTNGVDYYCQLSEIFSVPSKYFEPFSWTELSEVDWRLSAPHVQRLGTLDDHGFHLLHEKLTLFLTGYELSPSRQRHPS